MLYYPRHDVCATVHRYMATILAVETSCDETGIAIIDTERTDEQVRVHVRADALLSQAVLHAEYGGVYPTLAKREHAKNLGPLFTDALTKAGLFIPAQESIMSQEKIGEIKELLEREPELFVHLAVLLAKLEKPPIDAVAVTNGPGLEPALWVGINFARALGTVWDIPVVPINHMEGHIIAAVAEPVNETEFTISHPTFPALALLISGGHTELVLMRSWLSYERIGSTRDDAAGEAFDKSARLIGLPYPGGPEISKLAEAARAEGLEQPFSLPRPMIATNDCDFSFSGLKTAVRTLVTEAGTLDETQKKQFARELEDAISDVLVAKTRRAIETYGVASLIVSGGVSANTHIRTQLAALAEEYNATLFLPSPDLATDNGRMIAFAASIHDADSAREKDIRAEGNLQLA